jgi:hypothetical protein
MQALLNTHCKPLLTPLMTCRQQPSQCRSVGGTSPSASRKQQVVGCARTHLEIPSKLPVVKQTFSGQAQCQVGWCPSLTPKLATRLVLRLLLSVPSPHNRVTHQQNPAHSAASGQQQKKQQESKSSMQHAQLWPYRCRHAEAAQTASCSADAAACLLSGEIDKGMAA